MKLLYKLTLGVGVLVLLTAAVVGSLALRWTEEITLREIQRSLSDEGAFIAELSRPLVRGQQTPELQAMVRRMGGEVGTRFTIIRNDGVVLADSQRAAETMDNHADRPEVMQAIATGTGTSTRYSSTLETRMMYHAERLERADGDSLAVVRSAVPLEALDRRHANVRQAVMLGSLLGLLVLLVPGYLFARTISRPVEDVTAAARAFTAGDYGPRLAHHGAQDELGELATAFNTMADQLHERMETITTDRNKLLAILTSMVEGVVAIDPTLRIVHMNEVAGRLLETDPETSIGLQVRDVTRMESVCEVLEEALETKTASEQEVTLAARPRARILELLASPLRAADGALSGALVVIHDVTELRRLEAVRRDFVANVSHELKTPLTAIRGMLETLLDLPDVPEDALEAAQRRRFLERARVQAGRLATIVSDLLALSRIESERAGVELNPIDLRGPVQESVKGLRSYAEGKDLTLEVNLPEAAVRLDGDREYLRQVVDNLVSNAISYTPSGGTVSVSVREEVSDAVLRVEDTGIGIAPDDRARIFERFYRVDKGRSRDLGGTGLGLAIVKHVVQHHGGEIRVVSELGAGTKFEVRLPRPGTPHAVSARVTKQGLPVREPASTTAP